MVYTTDPHAHGHVPAMPSRPAWYVILGSWLWVLLPIYLFSASSAGCLCCTPGLDCGKGGCVLDYRTRRRHRSGVPTRCA